MYLSVFAVSKVHLHQYVEEIVTAADDHVAFGLLHFHVAIEAYEHNTHLLLKTCAHNTHLPDI